MTARVPLICRIRIKSNYHNATTLYCRSRSNRTCSSHNTNTSRPYAYMNTHTKQTLSTTLYTKYISFIHHAFTKENSKRLENIKNTSPERIYTFSFWNFFADTLQFAKKCGPTNMTQWNKVAIP